ncbi:hypothetical protein [Crenobacter luteus]|nr:hypothetical protein [Crenobacter luteus]
MADKVDNMIATCAGHPARTVVAPCQAAALPVEKAGALALRHAPNQTGEG